MASELVGEHHGRGDGHTQQRGGPHGSPPQGGPGADHRPGSGRKRRRGRKRSGAGPLYTVMEKLLEEISFDAGKRNDETLTIDATYVDARLKELAQSEDLARYVL